MILPTTLCISPMIWNWVKTLTSKVDVLFKVLHQFYKVSCLGAISLILYSFSQTSCHPGMLYLGYFSISHSSCWIWEKYFGTVLSVILSANMLVCGESVLYYYIKSKEWNKNRVLQALGCWPSSNTGSTRLADRHIPCRGYSALKYFNAIYHAS